MADETELFYTPVSKVVVFATLLVSVSDLHKGLSSFVFPVKQITQKTVRLPAHPTGLALAIIDFSVYPKNGFFVSSALKFCPTADLKK